MESPQPRKRLHLDGLFPMAENQLEFHSPLLLLSVALLPKSTPALLWAIPVSNGDLA
jgi:hypothetical protein